MFHWIEIYSDQEYFGTIEKSELLIQFQDSMRKEKSLYIHHVRLAD